jgi:hypothetical protein
VKAPDSEPNSPLSKKNSEKRQEWTSPSGLSNRQDIDLIASLGNGSIDFTVGSALDIFGGSGLRYDDLARNYGAGTSTMDRNIGQKKRAE